LPPTAGLTTTKNEKDTDRLNKGWSVSFLDDGELLGEGGGKKQVDEAASLRRGAPDEKGRTPPA